MSRKSFIREQIQFAGNETGFRPLPWQFHIAWARVTTGRARFNIAFQNFAMSSPILCRQRIRFSEGLKEFNGVPMNDCVMRMNDCAVRINDCDMWVNNRTARLNDCAVWMNDRIVRINVRESRLNDCAVRMSYCPQPNPL